MNSLKQRIDTAQESAIRRTRHTEPEVSWFLAAADLYYWGATDEPSAIQVMAHFRSWYYFIPPGVFKDLDTEEIATLLLSWIRKAMEGGFLDAEDPPRAEKAGLDARTEDLAKARLAQLRDEYGMPPA